jgi:succinate-acetate transporter protein
MRKIKILAGGLCVLFAGHLIHRINNTFMTAFGVTWIMPADLILCAVAQYVLPVTMWLWLVASSSQTQVSEPGKRVDALKSGWVDGLMR